MLDTREVPATRPVAHQYPRRRNNPAPAVRPPCTNSYSPSDGRIHHHVTQPVALAISEEDIRTQLIHRTASRIGHRLVQLVADQADRLAGARLAADRRAIERRATG